MLDVIVNKIDLKRLRKILTHLKPTHRRGAFTKGLKDAGLVMETGVKKNLRGKILKVGTGRFWNSIQSKLRIFARKIVVIIGSGVRVGKRLPYANIHETGGIIKPRRFKYLRFQTKDGAWHRVKQVIMPSRKYLSISKKQNERKAIRAIIKKIETEIKKIKQ